MGKIRIRCTKYNEINVSDVREYITSNAQIKRGIRDVAMYAGSVNIDDSIVKIYSTDTLVIHNVELPVAVCKDCEYDHELIINDGKD